MKKRVDWDALTPKEMFERSKKRGTQYSKDFGESAVKIGLLLLMPYIFWLTTYSDSYVETLQGQPLHLDFEGVMLTLHNLFTSANLIVHESGHGICYLLSCPEMLMFLNGTLFQLALPAFVIYYYHRRGQVLGVGLGALWLAQNLIYVAWYMSYAQTPNKYPFFLGGSAIHDFWYIFSHLGVLEYDWLIAGIVRSIAVILLLGSYSYLLYNTFIKTKVKKERQRYE